MNYRSKAILGAAFLAPLLALVLWLGAAPSNRCTLNQNLGYVFLAKGTLASRVNLGTAQRFFAASTACQDSTATFGLGQADAALGQLSAAMSALQDGGDRVGLRHFLLGRIYEALGRPDDARTEYGQLPLDAAAAFYRMGDRADKKGDYQKAIYYFSVSAMINPAYPKPYYGAAFVYWRRLGDEGNAVTMIRQALAVDVKPSVERDFYQGLLCYYHADTECALTAWVSAVREPPTLPADPNPRYLAYEMLSRALHQNGPSIPVQMTVTGQGVDVR